ncbi:protein ACCELERATED CELL DEATH 6-like protein isoform X2 [Cinnamomum micranthum f. kanehirae]|uniref:Protein ACCELERATED CELL DEATH 6-like protein isoform X2 n=1 Tax=Cinnamomum micranthum f. kanehirae TaxID=337451 RepID=A0A3S3N4B8_9MAGN|nr:protein ACCELERATED CELL DEATH 6-like protein isoform X2 [Cinnamomum micranthum f. kanehirae]
MDKDGRSPFLVAANNGHVGVIKELLRFCPDSVEVADKRGRNVLHVAVKSGRLEVMKYILKSDDLKELINEPDSEGNTPLHLAVIKRNVSVLNLLLKDKRVDTRAINNNGMTALEIAESDKELTMKFRKIVICTALIQAGALRGGRLLHTQANGAYAKIMTAPRIESYRAMSKTILVVAGLIITVTFAAAFSIPGGYNNDGLDIGMAVLRSRPAFWAFMITDAIALFSSIIVALLLIWAGIGDTDLLVGTVSIATRLMAIALGSLTLAFLSSLWLVVSNWLCIVVLSIFILVLCLSLHSFCFQFSLLLLLFKQMILNYLVYPIFNSEKRSAVQSLENMETRHLVRVKSKYSINNIECLLVDSQPPSAKKCAM